METLVILVTGCVLQSLLSVTTEICFFICINYYQKELKWFNKKEIWTVIQLLEKKKKKV